MVRVVERERDDAVGVLLPSDHVLAHGGALPDVLVGGGVVRSDALDDGGNAHALGSANHPACNLAAIGDEDFGEHQVRLSP